MFKKLLILCLLGAFFLVGCSTAAENGTTTDQLQQEINQLQKEVTTQRNKADSLQRENDSLRRSKIMPRSSVQSDILVQKVDLTSNQKYTRGKNAGAIYGTFNVVATLKNVSDRNYNNVKVVTIFQKNRRNYNQTKPTLTSAVYTIPTLKAGQKAVITFRGFRVDHPNVIQEIIVTPATFNDISKTRVSAAFAPGDQD